MNDVSVWGIYHSPFTILEFGHLKFSSMDFMVNIDIKRLPRQINYQNKIMLVGSCFTEHIGNSLEELKFRILQNPNGILFDPLSVSYSLLSYIEARQYATKDFFQLNEIWHSWKHHSRFSNTNGPSGMPANVPTTGSVLSFSKSVMPVPRGGTACMSTMLS